MVCDIMTPVVFSVLPDTSVEQVIEDMLGLKVHQLFVVDRDGILVGVISASTCCATCSRCVPERPNRTSRRVRNVSGRRKLSPVAHVPAFAGLFSPVSVYPGQDTGQAGISATAPRFYTRAAGQSLRLHGKGRR